MADNVESLSLEQAMDELEAIAGKMEQGNVSMEETMQLYERGMALAQHCRSKLDGYQLRIQVLHDGEEKSLEL